MSNFVLESMECSARVSLLMRLDLFSLSLLLHFCLVCISLSVIFACFAWKLLIRFA